MIYEALQSFNSAVVGLGLFQRYAPFSMTIERYDEHTTNDSGAVVGKTEKYPVSWGLTSSECWESGRYLDLVPNMNLTSLAYFRQLSDLSIQGKIGPQKAPVYVLEATVQLLMFFNVPKMNISGVANASQTRTEIADKVASYVVSQLDQKKVDFLDTQFTGATARLIFEEYTAKDLSLLSDYTYADKQALMLWPFDFGAINFTLKVKAGKHCIGAITPGTPIECQVV